MSTQQATIGYLVDPAARTITEVGYPSQDDRNDSILELLGGVRSFEGAVFHDAGGDGVFVGVAESGVRRSDPVFVFPDLYGSPFPGKGLIIGPDLYGTDADGNFWQHSGPPKRSLDYYAQQIRFMTAGEYLEAEPELMKGWTTEGTELVIGFADMVVDSIFGVGSTGIARVAGVTERPDHVEARSAARFTGVRGDVHVVAGERYFADPTAAIACRVLD